MFGLDPAQVPNQAGLMGPTGGREGHTIQEEDLGPRASSCGEEAAFCPQNSQENHAQPLSQAPSRVILALYQQVVGKKYLRGLLVFPRSYVKACSESDPLWLHPGEHHQLRLAPQG